MRRSVRAIVLLLLACVTSGAPLAPEVDAVDCVAAERDLLNEQAHVVEACCLLDDHPYTIRFALSFLRNTTGRVTQHFECVRPWRTFTWRCIDVVLPGRLACG